MPSVRSFLGGIFDYDAKHERLEEVTRELESSDVWNEPERAQALGKERASLEAVVKTIDDMDSGLEDVEGLLELAVEEEDEDTFNETTKELDYLESRLADLEFRRMFSGPQDASNCYLNISRAVAVLRLKIGPTWYCVCTYVGVKPMDSALN